MPKALLGGRELEVDEEGYLQEPEKWDRDVAEDLAKTVNASASPMYSEHWKIVDYIRNYYLNFKIAPPIRILCKRTGFDLKQITELFPSGPVSICKVAGLPKPTGCV
jgi:TusE/DsrC/DsvC family sulfur relay protein